MGLPYTARVKCVFFFSTGNIKTSYTYLCPSCQTDFSVTLVVAGNLVSSRTMEDQQSFNLNEDTKSPLPTWSVGENRRASNAREAREQVSKTTIYAPPKKKGHLALEVQGSPTVKKNI